MFAVIVKVFSCNKKNVHTYPTINESPAMGPAAFLASGRGVEKWNERG